jgi:hypothetical protein
MDPTHLYKKIKTFSISLSRLIEICDTTLDGDIKIKQKSSLQHFVCIGKEQIPGT